MWRRIFTFNIDHALEVAYASSLSLQTPQVFHFKDAYAEIRRQDEVPLIHLHGIVRSPDRGFVFSTSEYVRQMQEINPWMVVLTQFLPVDPFMIVGTSLDEVDLEYYLAHRTAVTARQDRGPSILVEPFPDTVTKRDCEKYNLFLVEGTAEAFLDYLDEKIPNRPTPLELVPPSSQDLFPIGTSRSIIMSFSADFDLVPTEAPLNKSVSKFFYGHPPRWQDLSGELDISRFVTGDITREIEVRFADFRRSDRILLVLDETGSGKTTVLRRIGYDFASQGVKVFLCSALSQVIRAQQQRQSILSTTRY